MLVRALVLLSFLSSVASAQRSEVSGARPWVGALDGLSLSAAMVAVGVNAKGAHGPSIALGGVAGAVFGVSGPIAHARRHSGRAGWSLALRTVLPLAHGMLGHVAEMQHDLRQPELDGISRLYGMVAGMAVGAALAAVFEQAWLLSDEPLTAPRRVTMVVVLSLIATIAIASFIPVWDAHYEATDDRVPM